MWSTGPRNDCPEVAGQRLFAGRCPAARLDFGLLRHLQRVIDLGPQVPHGTLQLAMSQQQLHCPEILCAAVDEGSLGATQRVRPVGRRIKADFAHPSPERYAHTVVWKGEEMPESGSGTRSPLPSIPVSGSRW